VGVTTGPGTFDLAAVQALFPQTTQLFHATVPDVMIFNPTGSGVTVGATTSQLAVTYSLGAASAQMTILLRTGVPATANLIGTSSVVSSATPPIPEPTAAALFLVGLATYAVCRLLEPLRRFGPSYFNGAGPRLVDGLEILAEILHPEIFPRRHRRGYTRLSR
jgi:hypothetical protein